MTVSQYPGTKKFKVLRFPGGSSMLDYNFFYFFDKTMKTNLGEGRYNCSRLFN
jgi:hypothetical protein